MRQPFGPLGHQLEDSRPFRLAVAVGVVALIPTGVWKAHDLHSTTPAPQFARGGDFLTGHHTVTPRKAAAKPSAAAPTRTVTGGTPPVTAPRSGSPSADPRTTRSHAPSGPARRTTAAVAPVAAAPSTDPVVAGPALPTTGTYALAVTGSERLGGCSPTLPATAQLVISKADGESDTSYDFDLRLYPTQPAQHDERHVVRYTAQGVFTDFDQAVVTCHGTQQSLTVPYTPPQLSVAPVPSTGTTWTTHGGGPQRTEDTTSTVTGTDTVVLEGARYGVDVIHTTVAVSGTETGTRERTWWWSPQLGIPLKWSEQESITTGSGTYSDTYTAAVTAFPQS